MTTLYKAHFSQNDLLEIFDPETFFKGLEYFKKKRVGTISLQQNHDSIQVQAFVQGSRREPYKLKIELLFEKGTLIDIEDECSCPLRGSCKHTVAALIEASQLLAAPSFKHPLERAPQRPQQNPSWNSWLTELNQSLTPPNPLPPHLSIYLIGEQRSPQLQLFHARELKRGGFSKLTPFYRSSSYELQKLSEIDQYLFSQLEAAALLKNKGPNYACVEYAFSSIPSFSHMQQMIETNRCFLKTDQKNPLTMGPLKTVSFQWKTDEKGQCTLQPCIDGISTPIVLPLKDSWYIDPESHLCGRLATDLSHEIVTLLLKTPIIPLEDIPHFTELLGKEVPQLPAAIQLPERLAVEELQVDPKPQLRLYGSNRIFENTYQLHYEVIPLIELGFIYAGIDIPLNFPKKEIHHIANGKHLKLIRQLELETKWLTQLLQKPLKPLSALFSHQKISASLQSHFTPDSSHIEGFFQALRQLKKEGWNIIVEKTFPLPWVEEIDDWYLDVDDPGTQSNWFDLELGVVIEGAKINLIPILQRILSNPDFSLETIQSFKNDRQYRIELEDGKFIEVPGERLRNIFNTLLELHITKNNTLSVPRTKAAELLEWNNKNIVWKGAENLQQLGEKLRNFQNLPLVSPPTGLQATLRPYQQSGLTWLQFLRDSAFGGVLADDMGLGKTIQTLAHLLLEKEQGRLKGPSLIVAPTSLMSNWKNEAARFTPELKVLILQGLNRKQFFNALQEHDIVLTTYPLLVRDQAILLEHSYYYLILDEAQFIKNAHAKATSIVNQIEAKHKLCLTGTPMENHLGELWTLFNFLSPGLLGNQKQFTKFFRTPIEKHNNITEQKRLSKRIAPFLLRRTKEIVAKELPPKTEIIHSITLEGDQRDLYETIRISMHEKVKMAIAQKGLAQSQIILLDALLKMRQACCDPRLVKLETAQKTTQSQKLEFLLNMIDELLQENRKILLFSSFTSMLSLIEESLISRSIPYVKLTGETTNRAEVISQFQESSVPLFLLSLKAGGVGLNLTAADTVIHYDPWWNPAAELQATDRAHRIGQQKPVFVYKLITAGTIEEKILKLQEKKQALINNLFEAKENQKLSLTLEELEDLFKPLE